MYIKIFAWVFKCSRLSIFSWFYADCIITCFKCAVVYFNIVARFNVYSITILCIIRIAYRNVTHSKIFTEYRMYVPCRRIHKCCLFQKYIAAIFNFNHNRSVKIIIICRLWQYVMCFSLNICLVSKICTFWRKPYATLFCFNNIIALFKECIPLSFCKLELFYRTP